MNFSNHLLLFFLLSTSFFSRTENIQEIELQKIFSIHQRQSPDDIKRLNEQCKRLNLELAFEEAEHTHEIQAFTTFQNQKIIVSRNVLEHIYNTFIETNPYSKKKAVARELKDDKLCEDEHNALAKRMRFCLEAVQKKIKTTINPECLPTIALCLSGGGYRALLASAGLMKGFDDNGILDMVEYNVGLSGSTWTLCPFAHSKLSYDKFYAAHICNVAEGFIHLSPKEIIKEIETSFDVVTHYILRKIIFKEQPSIVDVYGFCLALSLLDEEALEKYMSLSLPSQAEQFQKGDRPLPVYTAVIPYDNDHHYHWLEITPWEVGSHDMGYAIPAWSYGRYFENGVAKTANPPLSAGRLMGMCGSAMTVNLEEVFRLFAKEVSKIPLLSSLELLLEDTYIGETRIFPEMMRNFTYKLENSPEKAKKISPVVDAGIHCNIPVKPLLYPMRSVDIIIVCDASGDVLGAPELKLAEDLAREHKLPFPKIDYEGITERTFTVFDDGIDSTAPIIIYIPFIKNNNYSSKFDPQDHMGINGFLNTLNFEYKEKQALAAAGLMEYAAHEVHDTILDTIKKVLVRKTKN